MTKWKPKKSNMGKRIDTYTIPATSRIIYRDEWSNNEQQSHPLPNNCTNRSSWMGEKNTSKYPLNSSYKRAHRVKRFYDWLNERPYPNTYNVNYISASSILVIFSASVFFVFYRYVHEINRIVEGYFIGTVLLIFSGVFLGYFIIDITKSFRLWFNYAKRWVRYITILLLIFLILYAGQQM